MFVPFAFGDNRTFGLPLFTLFYGLDWVATVPPTVRLTVDAFGREKGPLVFGWISAGHQLGASSIALIAGMIRTTQGSYDSAFYLSAVLCLVAAAASLTIGLGRRPALQPAAAT